MAFEDIERLKEKITKDPNSKLFVPLAEEYKKAGMFDEAIDVLIKGLERQPGYLSARVSLGKIYTERGMLNEAKDEFEKVTSSIPDNLYAHKKLAEIYSDLGEKDKAVNEFKAVLKLNPMDEWATASLAEMEETKIHTEEQTVEKTEEDILEEEIPVKEGIEEETEELAELHLSEENIELLEPASEEVEELIEEQENISNIVIADEELEFEESSPEPDKEKEAAETLFDIPVTEEDLNSMKAPEEAIEEVQETLSEGHAEIIEEISEVEEELSFEGLQEETELVAEEEAIPPLNLSDADPHILQGNYTEAMNVYRKLLSLEPENKQVLQRVEELKALLKLLGKDKEDLIARMGNLLEGIKRRRDEFFGSS
ncbi:MAG: hypothetical protein IBX72_04130 [Nitrospirae bacterium]|jgi:tetratricopeptide (TPR) repeat protein|nr:hypothetical protein [Nitrospirota bacterium]